MSTLCGDGGTVTITDSAQATALSVCLAYNGSISVGDNFDGKLSLDGIQTISGALSADHVHGLTSLTADSLRKIYSLQINDTTLQSLDLPVLTVATSVLIQQNADLARVDLSKLGTADDINLQNNGHGNFIINLASLRWATHLVVGQSSSVDLSLLEATGDLTFVANNFQSLSLPALTSVLGGLVILSNDDLGSISAPALTKIELPGDATFQKALIISSNPTLTGTIDLPAVQDITHNAEVVGNFSSLTMPALTSFSGNFTIESAKNIQSTCNYFKDISETHSTISHDALRCIYPMSSGSSTHLKSIIGGIGGAAAVIVILGVLFIGLTFKKIHRKGISLGLSRDADTMNQGIEMPSYGATLRS